MRQRHRVHAEAGHALLNPETHDLEDLGLHERVRGVKIGLKIIEAWKYQELACLSCVEVDFCTPGNTMPLPALAGFRSAQAYQSR